MHMIYNLQIGSVRRATSDTDTLERAVARLNTEHAATASQSID